jgi:pyruvate/2-oxoglutarate dehydrogenase complex dihydrolipoamide dehydrogenase (E3) component
VKHGIIMNTGCSPKAIKKLDDGSLELTYQSPDGDKTKVFDAILMATGRGPNSANLGLENAGVETTEKGYERVMCLLVPLPGYCALWAPHACYTRSSCQAVQLSPQVHNTKKSTNSKDNLFVECSFIIVDEYSKTSADNIYAIGDITDRLALTPVALMEGGAMAHTLFNDNPTKPDHINVPTAVFSNPHIGTIGYSEEQAVEKFGDVDVYSSSYRPMRATISGNQTKGFMKILVDASSSKVVGIHIVGPESAEILQVCSYPK